VPEFGTLIHECNFASEAFLIIISKIVYNCSEIEFSLAITVVFGWGRTVLEPNTIQIGTPDSGEAYCLFGPTDRRCQ